jgi:hypothetical protein
MRGKKPLIFKVRGPCSRLFFYCVGKCCRVDIDQNAGGNPTKICFCSLELTGILCHTGIALVYVYKVLKLCII